MQQIKVQQDKQQFWVAMYDGDYLCQYSDGKENLFKDIDQSKLKQFIFVDRSNPAIPVELGVHIETGAVTLNNVKIGTPAYEPVKLIFFKRMKAELKIGGGKVAETRQPELEFFGIGYEYHNSEGKISKRIIKYRDHTIL